MYISPEEIEEEADKQKITLSEIKGMIRTTADRINKKREGNILLIEGVDEVDR